MSGYIKNALVFLLCGVCLLLLTASGKTDQTLSGTPVALSATTIGFTDITATSGINAEFESPHGAFFADANGDGKPDLYITTYINLQNSYDKYYLNTTVGSSISFSSQSSSPAIDFDGGSHGAAWADLDNDGDYDLVNGGTINDKTKTYTGEENQIYMNTGSGILASAIVLHPPDAFYKKTRAVVAFDKDGDGDLDLFTVSGYLGSDPAEMASNDGHPNEVYENDGNGNFTALTQIQSGAIYTAPAGQGATDCDYDDDGDIDIFAANRSGTINVCNNNGSGYFTLVDASVHGINNKAGDGITMGDVDNDGDFDMIITTADDHAAFFYENNKYFPSEIGITQFAYTNVNWTMSGYSAGLVDIDNDGDLDLFFAGETKFYRNNGDGTFEQDPTTFTLTGVTDPRSISFADVDNDGDMDFVVGDKGSKLYLVRNDLVTTNHYLKVKLISPQGQAGAFGSKVYVTPDKQAGIFQKRQGGLPQLGLREARSSTGYICQNDPVLHFGLGSHTSVDVTVEFMGGYRATRTGVSADQTLTIDQADVQVAVKVFLEGPYNTSNHEMNTDLNDAGLIQTFSPYDGRILPSGIPTDRIVDWVYIQLRETASGSAVASKSALLRDDGMVVADDGITEYIYLNAPNGNTVDYYIVVNHRNHLKIMSATSISLDYTSSTTYDFTDNINNYYGAHAKTVATTVYAMYAGDGNNNGEIQIDDNADVWWPNVGLSGYLSGDYNVNGEVQIDDQADYWWQNVGVGSQVP